MQETEDLDFGRIKSPELVILNLRRCSFLEWAMHKPINGEIKVDMLIAAKGVRLVGKYF